MAEVQIDESVCEEKLDNAISSHVVTDELGIAVGVIEVEDVDCSNEIRLTFPSSLSDLADLASDASHVDQTHEPDADQDEDISEISSNVKWTDQLTKLLLRKRLSLEYEFEKSSKKRKLWEDVSKFLELNNYKVSPEECDKKYRNLLVTYRKNKMKADKCGRRAVYWPYYDIMDKVLGVRNISLPKTETILSTTPIRVLKCSTTSLPHSTGRSTTVFIESDTPANPPLKKRKLRLIKTSDENNENPPKWFMSFMERMKQQEEERQKREEKRWTELAKMEKEKIIAIKDLINVIKSKN
ncbi:hypothetical protein CHUAL_001400 [Chamberlinius hualienensis]